MVQLPDDPPAASPAVASDAPGMLTAEAYELVDGRARIEGLEWLIDEIASQREKLERERDDWRDAAQREGEASRELRVLLKGAQDSTRTLTATIGPQVDTESQETTHTPQNALQAAVPGVSIWERLRRLFVGE